MTSLTTDRSVNGGLGRGDSTDNLLAGADLSPPEVLLEPGGGEAPADGKGGAARPALLTAPSFEQRAAPALADSSPWSSSETSTCRSRKNSVNLLEAWVASGIGLAPAANGANASAHQPAPSSHGNNSNTLAIGQQQQLNERWGDVVVRTAPPSQSSVDSAILGGLASGAIGAGNQSRNNRSVPDIELHYRRGNSDERTAPCDASPRLYGRGHGAHHSQSFAPHSHHSASSASSSHHHHHQHQHQQQQYHAGQHGSSARCHPFHPQASLTTGSGCPSSRPRICEHQPFSFSLSRATSRESVRSAAQCYASQPPESSLRLPTSGGGGVGIGQLAPDAGWACPASRGEMLRQHSQPESTCYHCHNPSTSLRQLKEPSAGSGPSGGCDIAGIAADTLRINGAIRQFRQVAFPVRALSF